MRDQIIRTIAGRKWSKAAMRLSVKSFQAGISTLELAEAIRRSQRIGISTLEFTEAIRRFQKIGISTA